MKLAFIGLEAMGLPLAKRLLLAGHTVAGSM
ncbi:MAG: NAD(P)-binding domain-containing protein [Burkholderiales bacterium]